MAVAYSRKIPDEIIDAAVEFYLAGNSSMRTAKKFNISNASVLKFVRQKGFLPRPPVKYNILSVDERQEIQSLYRSGKYTYESLMEKFQRSSKVIRSCIRDAGLKIGVSESNRRRRKFTQKQATANKIHGTYRRAAAIRKLDFCLSPKDVQKLIFGRCCYCNSVSRKKPNGIDRQNNLVGYTIENCVTCCWKCNRAKFDMSVLEFFDWIKQVYEKSVKQ